jgi:arylsulfatase
MYEGGISSPMIAHWPGQIPKDRQGEFVREPAHLVDLLPTFLELARAKPDNRFKPEGQSIVTMIKGGAGDADRTFAWEHEGNRAIRKGKWKLVRLPEGQWELYDIEADRAEQRNLAGQKPEIVKELSGAYHAWAKRCGVVSWEELAPKRPKK